MKATTFITAAIVILLFGPWVQAGVSIVHNGSFENDGTIGDIATKAPQYWCDVNLPGNKFSGYVNTVWWTHGYNDSDGNSLTLYSKALAKCNAGDMAMVSQQIYLADVNQIIFDLKLTSSSGTWDPNKRSAVVLIDGDDVWNSSNWAPDSNDEYRNQTVDVNEIYKDANSHTLSLAIKSDVNETLYPYVEYMTRWDFVKFDTHCGGFGYLPEDFSQDCYVNFLDFAMLADHWLEENPPDEYDLVEDGAADEYDLMVFADGWLDCSYWENWQDDNCYEVELLDADLNDDGIVNLVDFAILTGDWGSGDDCIRSNIDRSGVVDYKDLSMMTEQWLLRSWVYGLE